MHQLERLRINVRKINILNKFNSPISRHFCSDKSKDESERESTTDNIRDNVTVDDVNNCLDSKEETKKISGFAASFEKYKNLQETKVEPKTFASLLRNSKFIDLGDPAGKLVKGTIVHIVDNDLYIDFGWKFNCVCTRPAKNASLYVRGSVVRLIIKDLELSSRFLGATTDLTLLEADCILLGLVWSPLRKDNPKLQEMLKI